MIEPKRDISAQASVSAVRAHRMRALARANEVRVARARLKRRVAAGDPSAAEVILAPPRFAEGWPLMQLLMSQRQWGRARARRFLANTGIDERKPLGSLTDRQRRQLAARLTTAASD